MLPTSSLQPTRPPAPTLPRGQTASASTSSVVVQQPRPLSFTAGYYDIFDAPERLREPSTHVRFSAAGPSRAAYSAARTARPAPSSLPPPILFDGPARPMPRRSTSVPHRAYTAYPAKVWPRPTGGPRSKASVAMSVVPLVVSGIGVSLLFGLD